MQLLGMIPMLEGTTNSLPLIEMSRWVCIWETKCSALSHVMPSIVKEDEEEDANESEIGGIAMLHTITKPTYTITGVRIFIRSIQLAYEHFKEYV